METKPEPEVTMNKPCARPVTAGYLNVADAARRVGVGVSTIYTAIARRPGWPGYLPAVRRDGERGPWMIREADMATWQPLPRGPKPKKHEVQS